MTLAVNREVAFPATAVYKGFCCRVHVLLSKFQGELLYSFLECADRVRCYLLIYLQLCRVFHSVVDLVEGRTVLFQHSRVS
jgi:hypothetical protein